MDFVAAHGHQINSCLFRYHRNFSVSLDCVYVEDCLRIFLLYDASNLFYGFHRADLIVDQHTGDKDRILSDTVFKLF